MSSTLPSETSQVLCKGCADPPDRISRFSSHIAQLIYIRQGRRLSPTLHIPGGLGRSVLCMLPTADRGTIRTRSFVLCTYGLSMFCHYDSRFVGAPCLETGGAGRRFWDRISYAATFVK